MEQKELEKKVIRVEKYKISYTEVKKRDVIIKTLARKRKRN
jgi:hypothetical protein